METWRAISTPPVVERPPSHIPAYNFGKSPSRRELHSAGVTPAVGVYTPNYQATLPQSPRPPPLRLPTSSSGRGQQGRCGTADLSYNPSYRFTSSLSHRPVGTPRVPPTGNDYGNMSHGAIGLSAKGRSQGGALSSRDILKDADASIAMARSLNRRFVPNYAELAQAYDTQLKEALEAKRASRRANTAR